MSLESECSEIVVLTQAQRRKIIASTTRASPLSYVLCGEQHGFDM